MSIEDKFEVLVPKAHMWALEGACGAEGSTSRL